LKANKKIKFILSTSTFVLGVHYSSDSKLMAAEIVEYKSSGDSYKYYNYKINSVVPSMKIMENLSEYPIIFCDHYQMLNKTSKNRISLNYISSNEIINKLELNDVTFNKFLITDDEKSIFFFWIENSSSLCRLQEKPPDK
jgi:hypothetical protein